MNRTKLKSILEDIGVRSDVYDLEGGHQNERFTLGRGGAGWYVYYSERGLESNKHNFGTEAEACEYLLNAILSDSSIRSEIGKDKILRAMLGVELIVIGKWSSDSSDKIILQTFVRNDQSFIPLFSSEENFRRETKNSGFENNGIQIKREFLASMLRGDELLILNPGSLNPISLYKYNLLY